MYKAPVVACIGAGQLARMMATEAGELSFTLRVLANSTEDCTAFVLPGTQVVVGAADDPQALENLLDGADVLTFEHELIPDTAFAAAKAGGVPARPSQEALLYAKDKLSMRQRLGEAGLPMPLWADGNDDAAVMALGAEAGWPLIAKVSHGGYDGRGVAMVDSFADFQQWRAGLEPGRPCLVEQKVPFTRELAVMAGRRPSGEIRTWQVMQTWQEEGQCAAVLAPAAGLNPEVAQAAEQLAVRIGEALDITGVFAVEMFLVEADAGQDNAGKVTGNGLYINELAMRPHNSGHWTQDGCVTSQFEQHLRAVLDLPLGDTAPTVPFTAMANVLGSELEDPGEATKLLMETNPSAKIHLYRKGNRPKRKLGHVNVRGTNPEAALGQAREAANLLMGK